MDLRFLLLLSAFGTCLSYIPKPTVQKLYSNLMKDYDSSIKPVYDQSSEIKLNALMTSANLLELDTTTETMTIMVYFMLSWTDTFLVWNSTEYGGIEFLLFKYEDIWHPSLKLGISADGKSLLEDNNDQVTVFSNGTVIWSPGDIISVLCTMDITFYPFDTQECSVFFYVRPTSKSQQDLVTFPTEPSKDLIEGHPEWHFLDFTSRMNTEYEDSFIYKFLYRRRASFIVYTTIVPLVLLSVLNACVILVPVSSGEKGSIAVTLFLSYCVYVTTIGATLPPNSIKISLIVLYMTIVQIFSGLAMLYSILETNAYIHGSHTWLLHGSRCVFWTKNNSQKQEEVKMNNDDQIKQEKVKEINDGQKQDSSNDEKLNNFRNLDHVAFAISLLVNVALVIALTFMTVNSLREKLN